ncbi:hypothetical protein DFQ30_009272, partial [Apophysomyces sp. BC1015]
MHLLTIGINHHTAPVALRERVAFPLEQIKPALQTLKQAWARRDDARIAAAGAAARVARVHDALAEAAILSTCNRTEIYCATDDRAAREHAIAWLSRYHRIPVEALAPHIYALPQSEAMKDAVRTASQAGALGTYLNQLFQRTFAVAKEVRGQTEIGAHSVSMAAAAVRLAQRIFENISGQRVLFIGAGEMIELCTTHFAAQNPRELIVANRTVERGSKLAARFGGKAIALADLPSRLHMFDIVVSCTASTLPIIGLGAVERALKARKHRPMFMVDLAVPRDIEPEVAELDDVFLYTVDDLGSIVREGSAIRQAAIAQAEAIIETRVQAFMHWLEQRSIVPVIRHMHTQADRLRRVELERAQKMLARGSDPAAVLEALSQALTNKFIHGPTHALTHAASGDLDKLVDLMSGFYQHASSSEHAPMKPSMQAKLEQLTKRLPELNELLSREDVTSNLDQYRKLTREHAELAPVVKQYAQWKTARDDEATAQELLADPSMRDFAEDEISAARSRMEQLERDLQKMLLPKDPNDERNIFVEVRAGTGGDESALFAGDLLRMYLRYAERHRWQVEMMSESASELGGYKEVIVRIIGQGAYSRLKFESGGHRVQR